MLNSKKYREVVTYHHRNWNDRLPCWTERRPRPTPQSVGHSWKTQAWQSARWTAIPATLRSSEVREEVPHKVEEVFLGLEDLLPFAVRNSILDNLMLNAIFAFQNRQQSLERKFVCFIESFAVCHRNFSDHLLNLIFWFIFTNWTTVQLSKQRCQFIWRINQILVSPFLKRD